MTTEPRLEGYELLEPPFDVDFDGPRTKEVRAYFAWFIEQIPERLAMLQSVLDRHEWNCLLDLRPDSLDCVSAFFVSQVRTRPRTEDEEAEDRRFMESLEGRLKEVVQPRPDWRIDETTMSLCVDVGIYFSEVMRKLHPSLEWTLWKGKAWPGPNRPVIAGFGGGMAMDASRLMYTNALKAVQRDPQAGHLRELLDYWSRYVDPAAAKS